MLFAGRFENIPSQIWTKIIKIDELKGKWSSGATLNPVVLNRLKKSVLVTSTGASTRIEGAHLADEDIEKLMRGISIQVFADRDKQEVRGYYELLQNIFNSWESLSFNENTIQHFHHELLKYVEKDQRHRGRYKKTENKVHMIDEAGKSKGILFDTTPAYLTAKEMQEIVGFTIDALNKDKFHPLLIIGNFLVEFLLIHPFQDGNGRLSRIITNFLMLNQGYAYMSYVSHEKLIEDNKPDYYMSLRRSQKTMRGNRPDITTWLLFFLDVIHKQAQEALLLLDSESIEKLLSPKQILVWEFLSRVDEAAPSEISTQTNVARPTVNQVLKKLLQMKKIEQLGMGRSTRYRKIS